MSPSIHSRPDDEEIEALAAAWLAQRDDGLSPQAERQFADWRRADPRHEAAVARLEATWALLGQLQSFRPQGKTHPNRDLLAPTRPPRRFWGPAAAWALAASVAVAAVLWLRRTPAETVPEQVYTTTAAGYQRMTLADGSVAELNTGSEIRVRYTAAERRVTLARGEALFTVAKNKERPFWVSAGSVAVRAVGTAFDVRLASGEVDVLVTEGRVRLSEGASDSAPEIGTLGAGQRAVFAGADSARPAIADLSPAAQRHALAWQEDRLVFAATPLAQAVEEFNRRNPSVQITIGDDAVRALPISGSFSPEEAEAFVQLLAQSGDLEVERPAPGRFVLRRAH